jgi:hypothetical protein
MYVIADHRISDPERFFEAAATTPIPVGMTLTASSQRRRIVGCVPLGGDSSQSVKELVESTVGDSSDNEFFEVNAENARGLPA